MSVPEASDNPLRFSSGHLDSYDGRLLPVCCPMRDADLGDHLPNRTSAKSPLASRKICDRRFL
jgi:hypothetical protein